MLSLRRKESKSFKDANVCYVSRIKFLKNPFKNMNYWKLRGHCHYTGKYRGAAHSICNLKFNVPNEIPVFFSNGSNYDYHFIIKKIANECEGQSECFGENIEKYENFSVPIEKEII